jgi:hypothetical protein
MKLIKQTNLDDAVYNTIRCERKWAYWNGIVLRMVGFQHGYCYIIDDQLGRSLKKKSKK